MDINGIGGSVGAGGGPSPLGGAQSGSQGGAFADLLGQLNAASQNADGAIESLATGGDQDLHDVMLAAEMESLSFELAVQIRNRLVEAYSEIFRMQV